MPSPESSTTAFNESPVVPMWPRLIRIVERWTITESIDGTHAVIVIDSAGPEPRTEPGVSIARCPDGQQLRVRAASRTRWLVSESDARGGVGRDNFGFATWVAEHAAALAMLGPGAHHGEWYGTGIGSGYGLAECRFALLDTARWKPNKLPDGVPKALDLVPVLSECEGSELNATIARCLDQLGREGSRLVAGAAAEGVIARSAADPRLALKAYLNDPAAVAVA